LHPDVRHGRRMALRNENKLYERECSECKGDIKTSYAPGAKAKVDCEKCYMKEVF